MLERNLAANGGVGEPVMVAQISAAAFQVTRVPPLLGRTLVEADEKLGSPAVVVLGHRLWQTRFGGDQAVVGHTVRLGDIKATVVGVMPEGFAFPVDDNLWIPLRSGELVREPGHDALPVFGRLAPGATLRDAQAEVSLVAARAAASFPDRYAHLTPQVLPYANAIIWLSPDLFVRAGVHSINAFAVLFLLLICGNVALLVFTRAATREREILVRTALGATRGRILAQLVVEALVLATLAAGLGLTATNVLLKGAAEMFSAGPDRWPFWFNGGLSPTTAIYAGVLTILAATIVGVVPGLKVIGRRMSDRLRQSSAGGGGLRMGGVWTGLIVAQIAATVVFSATAYVVHRQAAYIASVKPVFPTAKYLSVRLEMDPEGPAEETTETVPERYRQRYADAVRELERRLSAEATVAGVTVAEQLPLAPTPNLRAIEVDGATPEEPSSRWKVGASAVAPDFFEVFQMPVLAGRSFDSRDLNESANTVVVNNLFVDQILGGRNAIGRRIRYESLQDADKSRSPVEPGPWLEIVGVVRDLAPGDRAPLNLDNPARPRLYRALSPSQKSYPLYLAVHARIDPQSLTPALRRIAAEVSPTLRLHDILPLDNATSEDARFWRVFTNLILLGSAIALALSLAGIYSVMSVTVSRRTREIGVRVALGAPAPRLIAEIFRRPFIQVAAGVIVGCVLVGAVVAFASRGSGVAMARHAALLLAYGIAMMGVCALACIGPILRALRVEPIEALKNDV